MVNENKKTNGLESKSQKLSFVELANLSKQEVKKVEMMDRVMEGVNGKNASQTSTGFKENFFSEQDGDKQ